MPFVMSIMWVAEEPIESITESTVKFRDGTSLRMEFFNKFGGIKSLRKCVNNIYTYGNTHIMKDRKTAREIDRGYKDIQCNIYEPLPRIIIAAEIKK